MKYYYRFGFKGLQEPPPQWELGAAPEQLIERNNYLLIIILGTIARF